MSTVPPEVLNRLRFSIIRSGSVIAHRENLAHVRAFLRNHDISWAEFMGWLHEASVGSVFDVIKGGVTISVCREENVNEVPVTGEDMRFSLAIEGMNRMEGSLNLSDVLSSLREKNVSIYHINHFETWVRDSSRGVRMPFHLVSDEGVRMRVWRRPDLVPGVGSSVLCGGGNLPTRWMDVEVKTTLSQRIAKKKERRGGAKAIGLEGFSTTNFYYRSSAIVPATPRVAHRCPCCESTQIAYNATADVWHCPNCSWSKRQLIEAPPGPKFSRGEWVVPQNHTMASQVVDAVWGTSEWVYTLRNEFSGLLGSGSRRERDDKASVNTDTAESLLREAGPNDPRPQPYCNLLPPDIRKPA